MPYWQELHCHVFFDIGGLEMSQKEQKMQTNNRDVKKIRWDIILFFNTLSAALIGLTTTSAIAAGVAKGLFYIFLCLFLMAVIDKILQRVEA